MQTHLQHAIHRRLPALLVAGLATLVTPVTLYAQAYPNKPIRLIVPSGPGGGADTFSRLLSTPASKNLGQSIVVENVPGVSGIIGADRVAKSNNDGHTVLWALNPIFTMVPALQKLPFEATDLQPACILVSNAYVWVTRNDFPAQDMPGLIELAKKSPGRITYASTGPGSAAHLGGALLEQSAGVEMMHVPFSTTGITEVMAGHVDLKIEPLGSAIGLVKSGKLKALGVTSNAELAALPGIKPVSATLPGYEVEGWHGLWVPAGTPTAATDTLCQAYAEAARTEQVSQRIQDTGSKLAILDSQATANQVSRELAQWKALIEARGIKLK